MIVRVYWKVFNRDRSAFWKLSKSIEIPKMNFESAFNLAYRIALATSIKRVGIQRVERLHAFLEKDEKKTEEANPFISYSQNASLSRVYRIAIERLHPSLKMEESMKDEKKTETSQPLPDEHTRRIISYLQEVAISIAKATIQIAIHWDLDKIGGFIILAQEALAKARREIE